LPNRYPRNIEVNPHNSQQLYIAYSGFGSGHIFRSDNGGTTWNNVSGSLPDVPFHSLLVMSADTVFAGSDLGVFFSLDGGQSWHALNSGLPDGAMVFDLVWSAADRAIVAFTHGNGVYKISFDNAPLATGSDQFLQSFTQKILGNPVKDFLQLSINSGSDENAVIGIISVSGATVKTAQSFHVRRGVNKINIDVVSLSPGIYFLQTQLKGISKASKFVIGG